jgi:hypothetical protein
LFQIGSAPGIRPLELSPQSRRLGIPAALTHMPLATVAGARRKANVLERRLGFWALFPL